MSLPSPTIERKSYFSSSSPVLERSYLTKREHGPEDDALDGTHFASFNRDPFSSDRSDKRHMDSH